MGGGHTFQAAPYMYGYTGNMAHGVMADWISLALESAISIHHIYSQTGLARGIGLYTESHVTVHGDGGELEHEDAREEGEEAQDMGALTCAAWRSTTACT